MKNIICIGRQYGSGGREIGEKLSEMLGIPCYDKLLIKKASLESGLSEDFISKKEESPINSIQFLSGNPYADIAGIGNTFYSESQMAYDAKEKRISVFIYADSEDKVKRVTERNQINEKEAANRIRHINRMRKQFFDFYSDTAWGNPESYDMMLSSSKFGINGCAKIIADTIRKMEEPENE